MRLRPPSTYRCIRLFQFSARNRNRIGPPDPISNIRPVIYDDHPIHRDSRTSPATHHPYSLAEFTTTERTGDYELLWKLHNQQLDSFHHNFWTDVSLPNPSFRSTIFSWSLCRATHASKQPKIPSYPISQSHPQSWIKKTLSQTYTINGSSRKSLVWTLTRPNGPDRISRESSSSPASNTTGLFLVYPACSNLNDGGEIYAS